MTTNSSHSQMLKQTFRWTIPLLFFCVALFFVTYQLLVYKCIWWSCAPERDFTVYDLNLPKDFFPVNAQISPLQPDRLDVSVEEASTTNYWKKGRSVYSVLQFSTAKEAKKWFDHEISAFEFTSEVDEPTPFEHILDYSSSVADQHAVFCGYISSDLQCNFGARYREFYVFFSGSMGNGEMSVDDFIGVMNFVDTKMQELLYSSK